MYLCNIGSQCISFYWHKEWISWFTLAYMQGVIIVVRNDFFEGKETAGFPKCCWSSFRKFWYMIWKQSKKPILHSLPIYWYKYQFRLSKPNHDSWFQMCNYSAIGASLPIIVNWLVVRVSKNQMPDCSDTSKDMRVQSSQLSVYCLSQQCLCLAFYHQDYTAKRDGQKKMGS